MRTLNVTTSSIQDVAFHPSGRELAVCVPGTLQAETEPREEPRIVWFNTHSWESQRELRVLDCARGCTWVEDADGEHDVTEPRESFPNGPTAFSLSTNQKQVVLAWPAMISGKWQQISYWNVETGTGDGPTLGPRESYVNCLRFSSTGNEVLGREFSPWNERESWGFLGRLSRVYFREKVSALAFAPNDMTVAYGTPRGHIRMWSVPSELGERYLELPNEDPGDLVRESGPAVRVLSFSSAGGSLAIGTETSVGLWDLAGKATRWENESDGETTALAYHPAGTMLAVARSDGAAVFLDALTGKVLHRYAWKVGQLNSVAFSPDGLTCAAGGEKGQVVVWDVDV
ncbi:wd40 repeat protein : WD40 repeat protein OS=Streptomyces davawensis JCM 4913 GN=BN159_5523 PE=4 SV=1: WD40 [Gemmataceae bacterium]|nr:wd40 repeat protein : WD40 repeat protein OS=Streptomyces davawensis JCM 4913 GN=BN159_5523 PE=4 SV=1: WD40 [Gemmataceae bacterium]VTU01554.1 wd40 repeat protein : WD40 repeat protein OS=Streptomyces davawensis JCM 4913 GN=BN159_5523 PE=4 SV=1: WD40 [Gemmataceae bacterium]